MQANERFYSYDIEHYIHEIHNETHHIFHYNESILRCEMMRISPMQHHPLIDNDFIYRRFFFLKWFFVSCILYSASLHSWTDDSQSQSQTKWLGISSTFWDLFYYKFFFWINSNNLGGQVHLFAKMLNKIWAISQCKWILYTKTGRNLTMAQQPQNNFWYCPDFDFMCGLTLKQKTTNNILLLLLQPGTSVVILLISTVTKIPMFCTNVNK